MTTLSANSFEIDGPVLVTGAAGFLGRQIVAQLVDRGIQVHAVVRDPSSSSGGRVFVGDIRDREFVRRAVEGAAMIIHAAGMAHVFGRRSNDLDAFLDVNEHGTRVLCEEGARAGVGHFVYVSSVAVYGRSGGTEGLPCEPRGPYAVSKRRGELTASEVGLRTGMPVSILRLATLYGFGDRGNVARLIAAIERGRFIWIGNGSNLKSLIHVTDAARACILAALSTPTSTEVYNVACAPVKMLDLVDQIAGLVGKPRPRWRIPGLVVMPAVRLVLKLTGGKGRIGRIANTAEKFVSDDSYQSEKFGRELGFHCEMSLNDGLLDQLGAVRNTNS